MERSMKTGLFGIYLLTILALLISGGVSADVVQNQFVPNELIVRYVDAGTGTVSDSVASSLNAQIGAQQIIPGSDFNIPGMQIVEIPEQTSMSDAIAHYEANPLVKYAEPNYIVSIAASQTIPDDPYFPLQWGLYNSDSTTNSTQNVTGDDRADIHAPEAWNITTGSSDIIVAVIDTGIDYTHEDLKANCLAGIDLVNDDNDPMDDNGHGTHCAGIIGATTNNQIGVAGVSWNSKVLPIKAFDLNGNSDTATIISAITYARENGAQIISCSWVGSNYSQALKDAIDDTPSLFVCSAGNSGVDIDVNPQYPASYISPNIISVGATDNSDELTGFSNYGATSVDLMAPGQDIYSTIPNGYGNMSGTSMSVPFVSGTAALVMSQKQDYSPTQIKNIILDAVDAKSDLYGTCVTGGRLNAYNGLSEVFPLSANFKGVPTSGSFPLTVQFIDQSSGEPESWNWIFGDGFSSTEQNPTHVYMKRGNFTVSLTVSKEGMSTKSEKHGYILVKPPYQPVKAFPDGYDRYYPPPTDPNNDGMYEDINGNGLFEYGDPTLLFDQIFFAIKDEPVGQFDFDGNGFIGFGDVVALYRMI